MTATTTSPFLRALLVQAGAIPVYLEDARNAFGSIGGIKDHCFNEEYIRKLIAERDPVKAKAKRPVRLAVIQLGTYDGCIYNAREVIRKIGHLCDYTCLTPHGLVMNSSFR